MYRRRSDLEYVQRTPEGRFLTDDLTELSPADVEEVCDVCEEPSHAAEDHPAEPEEVVLDPNATLADLRQLLDVATDATVSLASQNLHRERAAELFGALDGWLTAGGALPTDWARSIEWCVEVEPGVWLVVGDDEPRRQYRAAHKRGFRTRCRTCGTD